MELRLDDTVKTDPQGILACLTILALNRFDVRQAIVQPRSKPGQAGEAFLTDRLKGPGMRWDKPNAEAIMALASLYHSDLWDTYWKSVRAAA